MIKLRHLGLLPALVAFVFGLKQVIWLHNQYGSIGIIEVFFNVLPALVLFSGYFWIKNHANSVTFSGFTTIIGPLAHTILILLIFLFTYFLTWLINDTAHFNTVTNTSQYQKILHENDYDCGNCRWLAHFPQRIPKNATNIYFNYDPGCLQGSTTIQLRYNAPSYDIYTALKKFQPLDKKYPNGFSDKLINTDLRAYNVRILLDAQNHGDYWNHGDVRGVAINTKQNKILYWAESW